MSFFPFFFFKKVMLYELDISEFQLADTEIFFSLVVITTEKIHFIGTYISVDYC